MKLYYKAVAPKYVKFQRLMMGFLAIGSLFSRDIEVVWLFFGITFLGLLTGSAYSLPTLFYKGVHRLFKVELVIITAHHKRYYEINTAMDFIDHLLRIMASGMALALYYGGFELSAWFLIAFLSIFMMLSAYFGFCLSALTYIGLENLRDAVRRPKGSTMTCNTFQATPPKKVNDNCTLARRCFVPYKRCDSCHVDITQCLGTKYNSVMIAVGLLMALFLFIDHPVFVQANILMIMALLFWLGYQMNYNTDELAQTLDDNLKLNTKLKTYSESLEAEVKRRTAEIEHLATHDMLTSLYNRFSFEKMLHEALMQVRLGHRAHIAYIDLDKFKPINDTAGHLAGDKLLCEMAALMTQYAKEDAHVARLGGDEFAVLFENIDATEAMKRLESLIEAARAYDFVWEDRHFTIGMSIGFATITATMQDVNAILHHADAALYRAKKAGRGQMSVHTAL